MNFLALRMSVKHTPDFVLPEKRSEKGCDNGGKGVEVVAMVTVRRSIKTRRDNAVVSRQQLSSSGNYRSWVLLAVKLNTAPVPAAAAGLGSSPRSHVSC